MSGQNWRLLWVWVGLSLPMFGCLEKQSDSEITIGGTYGGVGGTLDNPGKTTVGNVTGDATPGSGTPGPDTKVAHETVAHVDRPGGFGVEGASAEGTPAAGGTTAAVGAPEPVAHKEVTHVDRPPGFGQEGATTTGDGPAGAPGSGIPNVPSPFEKQFEGQKMITLSGTLTMEGDYAGVVDVDCFLEDPKSGGGRKFVNKIKAQGPGTFTMRVPADYGKIHISAFLDLMSDGPDPKDPQGSYLKNPVTIGTQDVSGLEITLKVGGGKPPPATK